MSELAKNGCLLEGDKETIRYRDDGGQVIATCPLKELAEACFKAIRNGRYFEINMSSRESVPMKLVLSRNKRSLVVRDGLGRFYGLVGVQYLGEKLSNVIRGWAANFEIDLVELRFSEQAPTSVPEFFESEIEKKGKSR